MQLLCPAKINLHLRVGPLRADGFHSLMSWFCTTGLTDTLWVEADTTADSSSPSPSITLACNQPDIPTNERNLVVKIVKAWDLECRGFGGASIFPIRATLQKRIPAGAGLGGGSSDGARALLAVDSLWNTSRPTKSLADFSARFGSDLPFFFYGPSSVCTGRGEHVRPISRPKPRWVLLILPPIHMPTGDVYRTFDAMGLGRCEDVDMQPDWSAWAQHDATHLLECLVNDLEAPAFLISPSLSEYRNTAQKMLGRPVRMSGSGSSLFTLYDDQNEAAAAEATLVHACDFGKIHVVELAANIRDDLTTKIEIQK